MRFYVGVTDFDWFTLHASRPNVEEVNFWKPSPNATFKALSPGELFLFKFHSPRNFITGGGFFTKFVQLPISLAWDAFGIGNGVQSLPEMRERIAKYRTEPTGPNPVVGCIVLAEPFFLSESEWIPSPENPYGPGKLYSTETPNGEALWREVTDRLAARTATALGPAAVAAVQSSRYGTATLVFPRLGQGAFRVLVTDAYERRCVMTNERTLPVLEAAHIKPYVAGGAHELSNGLLLRSDLHTLFDQGYVTVDPKDCRVVVSNRIREEFENGRLYYALHGTQIREPNEQRARPSPVALEFHAEHVFR